MTEPSGFHDAHRVSEAWMRGLMLYFCGAVLASVVDHYVGNLDRSNLRLLYVILGVMLMGGSTLWLRSLKQAVLQEVSGKVRGKFNEPAVGSFGVIDLHGASRVPSRRYLFGPGYRWFRSQARCATG